MAGSADFVLHLFVTFVTLFFQLQGQFFAPAANDPSLYHDVDMIGNDVIEQALVMRDDKNPAIRAAHGINAVGDDLERVDIEAAVGFVEDRVFRFEHGQLQNFVPLLFAAGKSFVDRARSERAIHLEQVHFFVKPGVIFGRLELLAFG